MEESDPVAAVSAALSRISEFPEGVPFARPRICIVMYLQQILYLLNYCPELEIYTIMLEEGLLV
jgi:hypothetical protein